MEILTQLNISSYSQLNHIYNTVGDIIVNLDEYAINDLLSGNEKDLDKLLDIMVQETCNAIYSYGRKVTTESFSYLQNLSFQTDYNLRKLVFNYFIASTLPEFEMNWHHIEWGNMVQLYKYLCIEAARDHCFGKDTFVLMFDGTRKKIQDIVVGDLVMGPDSKLRRVLSLHKGIEDLYKIKQTRGDSYIVNKNHILSLYKIRSSEGDDQVQYCSLPELQDISISDYQVKSKTFKEKRRGYKVSIEYLEQEIELDPYYLGIWLGDGTSSHQGITSFDSEVKKFLRDYSKKLSYRFREGRDGECFITVQKVGRGKKNFLLEQLRKYNLLNNKHIPREYLINSKEVRLRLLAGLIDSDGSMSDNIYYYTTINQQLVLDIKNLADSLGFRTYLAENNSYYKSLKRNYQTYQITISGLLDQVPVLLERKRVRFNGRGSSYYKPQSFDGYDISILSNLSISYIGKGEYYGFECDGDHRFCLGDSTVVHNSKSFSFSFAYPLWKLFRYEKRDVLKGKLNYEFSLSKEGMLITNEFKLGKKLLKKIKEEIDVNDYLREYLRPDTSREGWGKEELTCKNGSSLALGSFGTSLRGPHPGFIIVDDFLDKSCLYSREQREKFKETFHGEIMNMILPDGQVLVIGTPFHEQDLYADLKEKEGWRVFEYPALYPDGTLLWENRYDYNAIMRKKEDQGSIIFTREILVRPISSASSVFPFDIIRRAYVGMDQYTLVENSYSFPKKFDKIVIGTDFGISGEVAANATVFVVVGVEGNTYWVINIFRGVGIRYGQQIAILKQLNSAFRPHGIVVEVNQMQKVFYQMAQDAGLPVIEHTTGVDKWSLTDGLPALSVLFEQDRMRLPRGDQKSIDLVDILAGELESFTFDEDKNKLQSTSGHGDIAMALWQAIRGAHYAGGGFTFDFI